MSLAVGQTAYYTRLALTSGIQTCKVQGICDGYLSLEGVGFVGYPGRDTFPSIEAAQGKAQQMAHRALKALEKKRARLEEIVAKGAKVAT